MHIGEKPFSCTMCPKRFADSHVLKNHTRTHTGEKPHECDICHARFAQQTSLRAHSRTHRDRDGCINSGKEFILFYKY